MLPNSSDISHTAITTPPPSAEKEEFLTLVRNYQDERLMSFSNEDYTWWRITWWGLLRPGTTKSTIQDKFL